MSVPLSFRNLEPTFAAGLIDDPVLLVRIRPTGRNLMFDCGQIHHLAKRAITRLDALFISHAHMDHWMGIDHVVRHLHASSRVVDLFGPPGLADKFEHKLAGYDWNLAEDYWGSFRVHEISRDQVARHLFFGPDGFRRQAPETGPHESQTPIYQTQHCQVLAETCEHRVDSLIYRVNESPGFQIEPERLAQLGLIAGPWLGELKQRFLRGDPSAPLRHVLQRDAAGRPREVEVENAGQLLRQIARPLPQASIGYISDVGFSAANRARILSFMQDVTLLLCECTFLREAETRARASAHLCTDDVNQLLEALRPAWFSAMHLSKTYSERSSELYRELMPPAGTQLLQLPLRFTPRPLLAAEMSWRIYGGG